MTILKARSCAEELIIGRKTFEIRFALFALNTSRFGAQTIIGKEIVLRGLQTVDDDHILAVIEGTLANLQDSHQAVGAIEPFG